MAFYTNTITFTRMGGSPSPFRLLQNKAEQELLLTYINAMHKMNPALLHNFAAAAASASASSAATATNEKREASDASASRSPTSPPPAPRVPTMAQQADRRMVRKLP